MHELWLTSLQSSCMRTWVPKASIWRTDKWLHPKEYCGMLLSIHDLYTDSCFISVCISHLIPSHYQWNLNQNTMLFSKENKLLLVWYFMQHTACCLILGACSVHQSLHKTLPGFVNGSCNADHKPLGLGHKTMVCVVCITMFSQIYFS